MSIFIGERWIDGPSAPGDFEKNMPAIASWCAENPPKDA
jgi:hypothetical protein